MCPRAAVPINIQYVLQWEPACSANQLKCQSAAAVILVLLFFQLSSGRRTERNTQSESGQGQIKVLQRQYVVEKHIFTFHVNKKKSPLDLRFAVDREL